MSKKDVKKMMYILCSISVFLIIIAFLISRESKECLGLPIIDEDELEGYVETSEFDISQMKFDGEDIAVDFPSNTIFISQSVENVKNVRSLAGEVVATNPEYYLGILKTGQLKNLSETVQEGKPLIFIIMSDEQYKKVNLIITTFPVLYLDYESNTEDEQNRNLNIGKMILWNNYKSSLSYGTVSSNAEWRLRGNSTRSFDKKAWKMNLRDENYQNNNLNLLGLGSDDDWILNPMSMDDTFVKEKFVQELWGQIVAETNYNYKMSKGEYIELIINGAYQGLYLLQRRIDEKYLEINQKTDILLKGINTWEIESIDEGYEIISTPLNEKDTYLHFESALAFKNGSCININNFIDVSLLLQFISGYDNSGYKNMFYLMENSEAAYELYLVPWDTDLSFGVTWGYNYKGSLETIIERQEINMVRENVKDLDLCLARRWKELRTGVFEEENIFYVYDSLIKELEACSAVQRDKERWKPLHNGKDSYENLKKFIQERLILLEEYYARLETNYN